MLRLVFTLCVAAAAVAAVAAPEVPSGSAENWAQFRGPGARGIASGQGLPDRWSAAENVEWKVSVPGRGWSSPVVWGDRVFLTTVVNHGETEPAQKGLYFGGNRTEPPKSVHEWKMICLELKSGKPLWERTLHQGAPESSRHLKNSYASETPVTDGERVYAYFGGVGLYCLDMEGKSVWSRRFEPRPMRYGWGTAASPALHGERLYIVNDNEEQSYLLALDRRTGKEAWRVDREEKSNWSTPYIWENAERTEIVTPGSVRTRSYGLDGKLLWWLEGASSITIATPFAAGGLLYVSSGYVGSPLKPIYAILPGAEGDISLPRQARTNQFIAWCDWGAAPYNPSTLVYDDRLYVLWDRGLFGAFDAGNGAPLFERERIPEGRGFTASPWAYDGKIFCLDEDGVTHVFRSGDRFEPLHVNRLADDDMAMATPAIAGDRLLIRTDSRLYCIRKAAQGGG